MERFAHADSAMRMAVGRIITAIGCHLNVYVYRGLNVIHTDKSEM